MMITPTPSLRFSNRTDFSTTSYLHSERGTEPARGALRDESCSTASAFQLVEHGGELARAGRGEGMADGDRSAVHVELTFVHLADRLLAPELFFREFFRLER